MIIVADEIRARPESTTEYEVHGTAVRYHANQMRWEMKLPPYLVWANTREEAIVTYRERMNETLLNQINNQIARDEITIHCTAKEVGHTAPYQYGDYCSVLVTDDDRTDVWKDCIVFAAERVSDGSRWMITIIHGWAGTNPFKTRVWCNDNGVGDVVQPVENFVREPLEVLYA
jgi:hypothetical protein